MKLFKLFILALAAAFGFSAASAQNVSINILTQNSGVVSQGSTVPLEVTVCNTDASLSVPVYKLRPRISVPSAIVSIPASGHTLPSGWTITANSGSQITLSNATDVIPPGACRTILILMQGNNIGGPSTVNSNLLFSNGVAPGTVTGGATPGDNASDNTSTSTVQVTLSTPVTLISFNAAIENCTPVAKWSTENESNSSHFEIQRTLSSAPGNWVTAGRVDAAVNSSSRINYSFTDAQAPSGARLLYRLKMTDRDGRFSYSPVIAVAGNCTDISVLVYPNPARNGVVNATVNGMGGRITYTLKTTGGGIVQSGGMINGTNRIATHTLPAGYYILTVQDNLGSTIQHKVIVQ